MRLSNQLYHNKTFDAWKRYSAEEVGMRISYVCPTQPKRAQVFTSPSPVRNQDPSNPKQILLRSSLSSQILVMNITFFFIVLVIVDAKILNRIILRKLICRFERGRNTAGMELRRWLDDLVAIHCSKLFRDQRRKS